MRILAAGILVAALAGCASHEAHTPDAQTHSPAHSPQASVATLAAGPGERIVTVGVPADFTPVAPSGATDEYRCFVVDPQLTEDAMVTGTEFLPGNAAIVHHSILYGAYPEQVAAAQALDDADPGPGYECFGGSSLPPRGGTDLSGLDESDWITAWAPGGKANQLPEGYGMALPAGSRIVIQMHYNLLSEQGSDNTQVLLRVTQDKRKPLQTMLMPAPVELPCAPGETGPLCDREAALAEVVSRFGMDSGATVAGLQMLCAGDPAAPKASDVQTCDRPVTKNMSIFAVAGHMHLLGREISVTVNPGREDEQTLLDIDTWDFDQQAAVPLSEPVDVGPGDTLRVRCRHDAGLRSQLPALKDAPPRYVLWGEGTTDEMCLAILISGQR